MLTLTACMPANWAQQTPTQSTNNAASELPAAPVPRQTEPLDLRQSGRDFSRAASGLRGNPINAYRPTTISGANFNNSVRLSDLVKDGKIYLSLSDAIALALENNYDIAIARYYLDIADTDILRARSGSGLRGVGATVLENTLGGTSQTLSSSGAPGTVSGAATGSSGIVLSTDGAGPTPEYRDPQVSGTVQLERAKSPETSPFQPRSFTNTDAYDFEYTQGFAPGTSLDLTWDSSRVTSTGYSAYSPELTSNFKATVTQHLLQGAGIWVNNRFMYEAKLNRQITDSTFRQQILSTVNQVENIYWVVVSAYEDVQAKQRALEQSTRVDNDTKKQLEIGTMAPLDVVQADSTVATDKQALISSESNLNYQQLVLKQAIARNLNDPALVAAPIIPTDRVNLDELSEEKQTPDELAQVAFKNRPELEQAVLSIKKDEITLRGAKNALLPSLDVYAFYGGQGVGGDPNKDCYFGGTSSTGTYCGAASGSGFPQVLNNLVNGSSSDKGVGFKFNVTIRNRAAQADQARSLIEYRQAEMHLEQLYTQIRMQVVAQQYAISNDRAQVQAALAARNYASQSLDAEQKKLQLGASTAANVLTQERNLANAENTLITANLTYAKDRALLYQVLAITLEHYGINLNEAATGTVGATPAIPGLSPAAK